MIAFSCHKPTAVTFGTVAFVLISMNLACAEHQIKEGLLSTTDEPTQQASSTKEKEQEAKKTPSQLLAPHGFCKTPTLVGFSYVPADTFSEGPVSGQDDGKGHPISANDRQGPFEGQPVQGFSAVQFHPENRHQFLFLSDNGFGSPANSADYLLRLYEAQPDFQEVAVGTTNILNHISLTDPHHWISFPIHHSDTTERLLTGADFDVESFVITSQGDLWIGDEIGPFLLHFNQNGELQSAPFDVPNVVNGQLDSKQFVQSPNHPHPANDEEPLLGGSRGFEGMAFNSDRSKLYPMLEGTVKGDPEKSLRIYEFDVKTKQFSGFIGFYKLDGDHAIGDFTPVNEHQFLVLERDHKEGEEAVFKKIFLIDFEEKDEQGFFLKTELVDLMNIHDPLDHNQDGLTTFTFPFVTIENLLVLNPFTILVANDNNYPFSIGRGPDIDNTEIIKIRLPTPLKTDKQLFMPISRLH